LDEILPVIVSDLICPKAFIPFFPVTVVTGQFLIVTLKCVLCKPITAGMPRVTGYMTMTIATYFDQSLAAIKYLKWNMIIVNHQYEISDRKNFGMCSDHGRRQMHRRGLN
jgi:hypothetical protein